ncbi:LytTR family transcriptional regulator, partial [Mycobacterium tuberculosis]
LRRLPPRPPASPPWSPAPRLRLPFPSPRASRSPASLPPPWSARSPWRPPVWPARPCRRRSPSLARPGRRLRAW